MRCGSDLVSASGPSGVNQTWTISPPFTQRHNAGGYLIEATIWIMVNGMHHTGPARKLRHREASPEGEIEATWEIMTRTPATWTPNMDGNPIPFTLYSKGTPYFGGHIGRVDDQQYPNGFHRLVFTGRGNYVTLGWNGFATSYTWPATTAGHTVVTDALSLWCPYVSLTTQYIIDGGLQIGQQLDGIGRTPRDLIDFVAQRGDSAAQPLDWYVRTDTDGSQKLWLLIRSRQPIIEIPITSLEPPTLSKDYEYRRNRVVIKYQGGYVDRSLPGSSGAKRWRYFDYSTQIDNEELAIQVADTYLNHWSTIEALTDGSVVLKWPLPISGVEHQLIRAGWRANITGWGGGFSLGTPQIKTVEVDHDARSVSLSMGKLIEDEMNYAEEFVGKSTKTLGAPTSGLIPQTIAPPEGVPQQVSQATASYGAGGKLGWTKIADDADVIGPVYMINAGYDMTNPDAPVPNLITPGRKFPDFQIGIGGRVVGFKLVGNDGDQTTPGPGTISIKVSLGHFGDAPAAGTLKTTVGIAAGTTGSKDLVDPTSTPAVDQKFEVTPGDYLSWDVQGPDSDPSVAAPTLNNVAIMILMRRTSGSMRADNDAAPEILAQTHTRDPVSGQSVFTVTTDRPCHLQIQWGDVSGLYPGHSGVSEIAEKTQELRTPALRTPFHWRVVATDGDTPPHTTTGTDQTA